MTHTEKKMLNILGLIVTLVILAGIVLFKYLGDQEKESTLATVLYIIALIGSVSALAIYFLNAKRDKSDYERYHPNAS